MALSPAYAWDGNAIGVPVRVDVTDGNVYGFRISLAGYPTLCGNTDTWAYINLADSNYNTYVATLLAAKAAGSTVQLYTSRDAGNRCHIGYIAVL
jgi:hypothetical protein